MRASDVVMRGNVAGDVIDGKRPEIAAPQREVDAVFEADAFLSVRSDDGIPRIVITTR